MFVNQQMKAMLELGRFLVLQMFHMDDVANNVIRCASDPLQGGLIGEGVPIRSRRRGHEVTD